MTTAEMFHFLGILLRISMEERDGGGYRAYFRTHGTMRVAAHRDITTGYLVKLASPGCCIVCTTGFVSAELHPSEIEGPIVTSDVHYESKPTATTISNPGDSVLIPGEVEHFVDLFGGLRLCISLAKK
jgi:hypothetical protein